MTKKATATTTTTTEGVNTMEKTMKMDVLSTLLRDADKRSTTQDTANKREDTNPTEYANKYDPNEPASPGQIDYLVDLNYNNVYRVPYIYPAGPVLTKREAMLAINYLKDNKEYGRPRADKLGMKQKLYKNLQTRYPDNHIEMHLDTRPASDAQIKRIVMNLYRHQITDMRRPEGLFLSRTDANEYIELLEKNAKECALRPTNYDLYKQLYAALAETYPETHITLVCDNKPEKLDHYIDDPFAEEPVDAADIESPKPPKAKNTNKYAVTNCKSSGQPKTLADAVPAKAPEAPKPAPKKKPAAKKTK